MQMNLKAKIRQVIKHKIARQKMLQSVYLYLGVFSTSATVVLTILPKYTPGLPATVTALLVLLVIGAWSGLPKFPVQKFRNNTRIEIVVGDIFEQNTSCVIGFSNTFDTDVANGIISQTSIQGQFLSRIYGNNVDRLNQDLSRELENVPIHDLIDKEGKQYVYPLGTVVSLPKEKGGFWYCIAYTEMDNENVAHGTMSIIRNCLDLLWENVDKKSNGGVVSIPLIGLGLARVPGISAEMALYLILFSFFVRSRESKVCECLRVVITEEDLSYIDIVGVQQFLYNMEAL